AAAVPGPAPAASGSAEAEVAPAPPAAEAWPHGGLRLAFLVHWFGGRVMRPPLSGYELANTRGRHGRQAFLSGLDRLERALHAAYRMNFRLRDAGERQATKQLLELIARLHVNDENF